MPLPRLPLCLLGCLAAWLCLALPARAQTHRDTLDIGGVQPYRLRPFVMAHTFRLLADTSLVDSSMFGLDAAPGLLRVNLVGDPPRVLVAEYETWPFDLQLVYSNGRVVREDVTDTSDVITLLEEPRSERASDIFGNARLQRSGSISRGVTAGSNRDATIESALRLQLEGEVIEGVTVRAALTDENTPILPEGTTQRLSEFDRVFVEIEAAPGVARLGDVDVTFDAGTFGRLNRKVQGGFVRAGVPGRGLWRGATVSAVGARPRGAFRVQEIQALDGVQGPYRLEGARGEPFILVVPGSEVVFLDGIRLTRDRSADYTIDYATGEVTFTPRRLLTRDQRIVVEFQYVLQQFSRTVAGVQVESSVGRDEDRATIHATFIREADQPSFEIDQSLTAADSLALIEAGDGQAFRSGAERVRFDPEAPFVQYVVQRTTDADSIFVPITMTPTADEPVYRVRFSRVPTGTGRYRRGAREFSGIVYDFVGSGGDYEPIRPLATPSNQQLLALGGQIRAVGPLRIEGEWAGSFNDRNRFSDLDDGDDRGQAYDMRLHIDPVDLDRWGRLSATAGRRFQDARFVAFERLRPPEFGQRYNVPGAFGGGTLDETVRETRDEGEVTWEIGPASRLSIEGGRLTRGTGLRADRQAVDLRTGGWVESNVRAQRSFSRDTLSRSRGPWTQIDADVGIPLLQGRLRPFVAVEGERRALRRLDSDTLRAQSLAFAEVRPGVAWRGEAFQASLSAGTRSEWLPVGADFERGIAGRVVAGDARYDGDAFQASSRFTVRQRDARNADVIGARAGAGEAVAIQTDARWQPLDRAVDLDLGYEAQTQRTPQLQEIYVRITPDLPEAQFVWVDDDGDGIRDLDEFVPETGPLEGTYARTFVPSDTLVGVVGITTRARLTLDPGRLRGTSQTRIGRLVRSTRWRTQFDVQERSSLDDPTRLYLLDPTAFQQAATTLNGRVRLTQSVEFFRGQPRYGLEIGASLIRTRNQLAGNTESRRIDQLRASGRYGFSSDWSLTGEATTGRESSDSERFGSRRYRLRTDEGQGGVRWTPGAGTSVQATLVATQKADAGADRSSRIFRVPLEARYARPSGLLASGLMEWANVRLQGDASGEAAFELTDGRGTGRSLLWNAALTVRLSRSLDLTAQYDGRAPSGAPTIHTGRMQLSATF